MIFFFFRFNIFKSENVHRSIFPRDQSDSEESYKNCIDLNTQSAFSFSRFCDLSPSEIENIHSTSLFGTHARQNRVTELLKQLQNTLTWDRVVPYSRLFYQASISFAIISLMESHSDLLFTRWSSAHPFFTFSEHVIHSMAETIEHRIIRSKSQTSTQNRAALIEEIDDRPTETKCSALVAEQHYIPRPPRHLKCEQTHLPGFLTDLSPKVRCTRRNI